MTFSLISKGFLAGALLMTCSVHAGDSPAAVAQGDAAARNPGQHAVVDLLPLARAAVAFDRDTLLGDAEQHLAASIMASSEQRCRFTAGRNPLRPRRNECRLA
jgi:hypothetical protein